MTLGEVSHDGGLWKTVNENVTGYGVNYAALKNHLASAAGHLAYHQVNSGGVSPGYDFFASPVTCLCCDGSSCVSPYCYFSCHWYFLASSLHKPD